MKTRLSLATWLGAVAVCTLVACGGLEEDGTASRTNAVAGGSCNQCSCRTTSGVTSDAGLVIATLTNTQYTSDSCESLNGAYGSGGAAVSVRCTYAGSAPDEECYGSGTPGTPRGCSCTISCTSSSGGSSRQISATVSASSQCSDLNYSTVLKDGAGNTIATCSTTCEPYLPPTPPPPPPSDPSTPPADAPDVIEE